MVRVVLLSLVFSAITWANLAPPHGAVEESATSQTKRLGIDLYSWGYTNPFSDWNGQTATASGANGDPFQIVNQITLHTPAFGPFDFEVTPQIVLQPFQGERFGLLDPSVGLEGTLLEWNGLTYWARYEVLLPVTAASRDEGMAIGPQAMQSVEYRIPRTRLRLEVSFIPTVRVYNNGETAAELYLSPRLFYDFSDSFALMGIVETEFESARGTPLLSLVQGETSLGIGCRLASLAGEGLWVQPFLNFFPSGRLASNAHLGFFFGGPLL